MHGFIISASIQLVPIVQDRHPYEWVDEAIALIRASGIKYEVGPFATVVEGTYAEVMGIIDAINEELLKRNCAEWICNVQLQLRAAADITSLEKVDKFRHP